MMLGTAEARITLNIADLMSNAAAAESRMVGLDGAIGRGTSGMQRFRDVAMGVGTALIVPMGIGLNAAMDLEQAIQNVNASLGGLPQGQLDALTAEMQRVGTASQFSATQVAGVADELARAGFSFEEIVGGKMTQAVVDLSQATGADLMTSVSGVTSVMNLWNAEIVGTENAISSATQAADIFTIAANESSAEVGDIIAGVRNLGPGMTAIGGTFEETAAAIALFTNNGMKAADSGISMQRAIENLNNPTAEAQALMNELGITAFDLNGNFVGLPALFDQLHTSMADMSPQARQMALSTIFGAEAMDVMTLAVLQGGDPLRALIGLMDESGVAAEQSAMRMDTLRGQWETLKEGVVTFLGSLMQGLIPGLRLGVDGANMFVDALMRIPAPIKTIIGAIGGALAAFAAFNIALQTSRAASALLGLSFAGMGTSLMGVLPIIALVAAAAGVLYLAWRTDFLGIRTITGRVFDNVVDVVSDAIDSFQDMWDSLSEVTEIVRTSEGFYATWTERITVVSSAVNTASRFLFSLAAAFRSVADATGWGWLGNVADGLDTLAGKIEFVTNVFDNWRAVGLNPAQAALQTLATIFPGLTEVIQPLQVALTNLNGAFQALQQGDYGEMFRQLGLAAQNVGTAIWNAIQSIDWAGIRGALWEGIQSAVSWIGGQVLDLGSIVVSVAGWVINQAQDLWEAIKLKIYGWLGGGGDDTAGQIASIVAQTQGVPIGQLAVMIEDWLVNQAGDLWGDIKSKVNDWVGGAAGEDIPIGTLGVNILGWTITTTQDLGGKLLSQINSWIYGGQGTAGGGALLADVVGSGGFPIASITVRILDWVVDQAGDLAGTIKGKIVEWIGDVEITSTDVITVGTSVASALGDAITLGLQTIADVGADVLNWLTKQIDGVNWSGVGNTVGTKVGEAIKLAIQGIGALLGLGAILLAEMLLAVVAVDWSTLGTSIKAFLQTSIEAGFDFAGGFVQGLFNGLFGDIKFDTITAKGAELVQSFTNGFEIAWPATQAWIASLPGKSVDEIGDLSGTLKGKGAELIQGFWDGAKDVWTDFIDWLTGRDEEMGKIGPGTGGEDPNIINEDIPALGGNFEFLGLGDAVGLALDGVTSLIQEKSADWGAALQTGVAPLGEIAATAFGTVGTAADSNMAAASAAVGLHSGAIVATSTANFGAMTAGAITNFTTTNATGSSNTAQLAANVGTNTGVMAAQALGSFGRMAGGAIAETSRMRAGTVAEAGAAAGGIVNELTSGGARAVAGFGSQMGRLAGVVTSSGGAAIGAASALGSNVGGALADALDAMYGRVSAAAGRLAGAAAAAMALALEVQSPSRFAIWLAEMVGEGLIIGFDRMTGRVGRSALDLAGTITDSLTPSVPSIELGLKGVYNDAARLLGREMGALGGAVIQGWEMLTNGFWRDVETGLIRKGILAEDGGYVNPSFYGAARPTTSVNDLIDRLSFIVTDELIGAVRRSVPGASATAYASQPASGATYNTYHYAYTIQEGAIAVHDSGDPQRTADVVIDRLNDAWVSTGRIG